MEIIEKIQRTFDDLDGERLVSIARTCYEMVTPIRLNLALCRKDQNKLKIIQSKRKEAKDKIRELAIKALYAVDLYKQHLDIEYKKQYNGHEPHTVPVPQDDTSIFKVDLMRFPDDEDEFNEEDHLVCALTNAQKVCAESILWTTFYSELEDMEQETKAGMGVDQKIELAETTSSVEEYSEEIKIKKRDDAVLPITEIIVPSKYLQIFKEGGAELFSYLQSEYTINNNHPVAKYSYIYRFLVRKQLISLGCQSNYMELIEETTHTKMSKIFTESIKYEDDILPILNHLRRKFKNRNKKEMN